MEERVLYLMEQATDAVVSVGWKDFRVVAWVRFESVDLAVLYCCEFKYTGDIRSAEFMAQAMQQLAVHVTVLIEKSYET